MMICRKKLADRAERGIFFVLSVLLAVVWHNKREGEER